MENFDVCVRGAGIVGKSLALTLARQGLQVALLPEGGAAAQRASEDIRAYALNAVSIGLLQRLKVWDALPAQTKTAVHDMRVQGDAAGGGIDFSAWQQRVGELAWIVDAGALERQLEDALRYAPHVTSIDPARGAPPAALLCCAVRGQGVGDALGARRDDGAQRVRPHRDRDPSGDRGDAPQHRLAMVSRARRACAAAA
jgi:glycine/D-amino acid oxidase-like deaminating enzyme